MAGETKLWNLAAVVTSICALTITGLVVRREIFPSRRASSASEPPQLIPGWQKFAIEGHRIGPASALVTILEFADFECPVCREFTIRALRGVRAKYGDRVSIVFRNWPLSYHRLSYPAARAAECVGEQGRFVEFHDLIYLKQDSLGLKSFSQFAKESGVQDSVRFERCNDSTAPVPAIEADIRAALAVNGRGTPTVIINGYRYVGAPDSVALDNIVQNSLKGKDGTQR